MPRMGDGIFHIPSPLPESQPYKVPKNQGGTLWKCAYLLKNFIIIISVAAVCVTIGDLECGYNLEEVTGKTTVVLSQACLEVEDGQLGDRAEEMPCSEGILSLCPKSAGEHP